MNAHNRTAWLEERRKGIGGSDIAAILGLSNYATPYDIWLDKRGEAPLDDGESQPAYWGTVLEDVVAKEYAKRTGRKVQRVNTSMQHPEVPIARANIDRGVVNPEIAGTIRWKDNRLTTDRLLECKTANGYLARLWGDEGSDEVPEYYLTQAQWYLGVTGAEVCDLAVLIGGQDYRTYSIARHDELIADMLTEAEAFWNLVQTGIAPDPQTMEDASRKWRRHVEGKVEIVGPDVHRTVEDLRAVKADQKRLEKREKELKLTICAAMGDAEAATHAGERLCTWKAQTATRLDPKALKQDHPEIFDLYATTSESRVLRLAPQKD